MYLKMFMLIAFFVSFLQNHQHDNDICKSLNMQHICNGNLNIPRSRMPQLTQQVMKEYTKTKQSFNTQIEPWNLIPTQSNTHLSVVRSIIKNSTRINYNNDICSDDTLTILVSYDIHTNDMYIIDSHHRYEACYFLGRPINVVLINGKILNILDELKTFNGVVYYN